MKRILPLFASVLVAGLCGSAKADTFNLSFTYQDSSNPSQIINYSAQGTLQATLIDPVKTLWQVTGGSVTLKQDYPTVSSETFLFTTADLSSLGFAPGTFPNDTLNADLFTFSAGSFALVGDDRIAFLDNTSTNLGALEILTGSGGTFVNVQGPLTAEGGIQLGPLSVITPQAVPEPSAIGLLTTVFLGVFVLYRRRAQRA